MAGWENDDLDEIIDQALTAPHQEKIAPTKNGHDYVMEKEGWSGDDIDIGERDKPVQDEVTSDSGLKVVEKRDSQTGWDADNIELNITTCDAIDSSLLPESNKEMLPVELRDSLDGKLHAKEGDDSLVKDESSLTEFKPQEDTTNFIPQEDTGRIVIEKEESPPVSDSSHLMDGWGQDDLDIEVPLQVEADPSSVDTSNQETSSIIKTTTLNGIGWEEDELDLDILDDAIVAKSDNFEFDHGESSTELEVKVLHDTIAFTDFNEDHKNVEDSVEVPSFHVDETRPALMPATIMTHGGWEDDTINIEEAETNVIIETTYEDKNMVIDKVPDMNRVTATIPAEEATVQIGATTAHVETAPVSKTLKADPEQDDDIANDLEAENLFDLDGNVEIIPDLRVAESGAAVSREDIASDGPNQIGHQDLGHNESDLQHQDFAHQESEVPDSPLPVSEKAPSGWQDDDFELDFPENTMTEETVEKAQELELVDESDFTSEDLQENISDAKQENQISNSDVAPEMMVHPSISMGWLDEDLDIPDFPSTNPLRASGSNEGNHESEAIDSVAITQHSEDESDREDKTLIEDEIPRRSLYDDFPTEQKLGWEDDELDLSEGDNGWVSDDIKLGTPPIEALSSAIEGSRAEDDDISPEDFFGAYTSKSEASNDQFDNKVPEDSYLKSDVHKKDSEEEPELTSPTQWFSGVLKTIGSDLKSKTVAGLDKLYEALDTFPESGTSSVPVSEASSNKFKGILDQLSPTTTIAETIEVAEGNMYVASDSEEMSVTDGEEIPDKFKGLFDTMRPSADDHLGRMMGKIGQTTYSLASHTKNKLTPAMQDFASKVKKKITEMPKRRLKRDDLDADVRRLLFREPEAMEALESIQIAACKNSIELKRMRKAGHAISPLFRDDPTVSKGQSEFQLDSIESWSSFESTCGIEFPLLHKVEMTRLLLLARNSADSIMEIYSSLDSAPESLDSELYLAIRLFSYRQIMADFTRLSLELLAMISVGARENTVRVMVTTFLSELDQIKKLSQQPSDDMGLAFPELNIDDITSTLSIISERLDIQPLLSIVREVYYAYEPIVAWNTLK